MRLGVALQYPKHNDSEATRQLPSFPLAVSAKWSKNLKNLGSIPLSVSLLAEDGSNILKNLGSIPLAVSLLAQEGPTILKNLGSIPVSDVHQDVREWKRYQK